MPLSATDQQYIDSLVEEIDSFLRRYEEKQRRDEERRRDEDKKQRRDEPSASGGAGRNSPHTCTKVH
eukprot:COSAG02_NODE_91_length_37690_cov_91.664840_5_plen_67_part_00